MKQMILASRPVLSLCVITTNTICTGLTPRIFLVHGLALNHNRNKIVGHENLPFGPSDDKTLHVNRNSKETTSIGNQQEN